MKNCKLYLLISMLLLLGVGGNKMVHYNGTNQGTASAQQQNQQQEKKNDSLFSKIQLLRSEMKKDSSDYFEIKPVYDLLEQVFSEKDSIALSPEDILGDESKYYLKYLDVISTGEKRQRIIEFGSKDKASTRVFIQSWDKDGLLTLQNLHQTARNNRRFPLIACNTLVADNRYYIAILTKINGSDIREGAISISFYTFEYDGSKWIPCNLLEGRTKKGNWELYSYASAPGLCWLENNQADSFNGRNYEIKMTNNIANVALFNKNEEVMDRIQLVFQNGRWGIN